MDSHRVPIGFAPWIQPCFAEDGSHRLKVRSEQKQVVDVCFLFCITRVFSVFFSAQEVPLENNKQKKSRMYT